MTNNWFKDYYMNNIGWRRDDCISDNLAKEIDLFITYIK